MLEFWKADLRDCPPTVVLCRVAYRLIARHYKVNPLHFGRPSAGMFYLADRLFDAGFDALATTCIQAANYTLKHKRKLRLWRFDVCRAAGKAILRSRDRRMAYDRSGYPRITNRGVAVYCSWIEELPADLPDVRTPEGRARL